MSEICMAENSMGDRASAGDLVDLALAGDLVDEEGLRILEWAC